MGTGSSRREPEVHVVVVQSQENGKVVDAKLLRQTYTSVRTGAKEKREYKETESRHNESEDRTQTIAQTHHKEGNQLPETRNQPPKRIFLPTSNFQGKVTNELVRRQSTHSTATPDSMTRTGYSETPVESQRLSNAPGHGSKLPHAGLPTSKFRPPHSTAMVSKLSSDSMASTVDDTMLEGNMNSHRGVGRKGGGVRGGGRGGGVREDDMSPVGEKGGNMFELFRTYDEEEEYTVYVREDGKRFYVDWEEQKWRYFPSSWNERGYFLPINYDPYQNSQRSSSSLGKEKQFTDVRAGEFIHPTKGKLITYLRQETMNVLYFFDEATGTWLPMPLAWERHVPAISNMTSKIQSSCPGWKDAKSIVALLRQSNYSVEDCISTYQSINDDGVLDYAEGTGRDIIRAQTEKKLKETASMLNEETERNRELRTQIEILQNRIEELEVECEGMKTELEKGKDEQRRKSKIYRQQSFSYGSRRIDPAALKPLLTILGEDARVLKAKTLALRNAAMKGMKNCNTTLQQLSSSLTQLLRTHRRQRREIHEVRTLYQKEALQRKLLFNEVQELRGNIRVFCRCRHDNRGPCALRFDWDDRVICTTMQGRRKVFEFERVYTPDTMQEQVFEDTKPIITSCVDGYNVCIIAYGQTGAGKTYTMMGPPAKPGVNIRSMKELFKICRERSRVKYTMTVSIVEVYNECVYDLLVPPSEGHEKLQVQKRGKEVVVPGLTEIEVRNMEDVMMVMEEGEKNRTVACTKMNTNSSRSHLLFMLSVEGYNKVSKATSHGRLTLVDLAGSERISRSEATGIRLVEAAAINKSLSALGQVFASIRNGALHIPYRNSKLTHLLQPCIGGDSKACMFVNISPLESNVPETISTLEFGQNVRQVELGKATKHVTRAVL